MVSKNLSIDLNIKVDCDHRVIWEVFNIEQSDRRSVNFSYPIANDDILLKINGFKVDKTNLKYGWQIVENSDSVGVSGVGKLKKILFNKEFKTTDDLIEVTYTSPRSYCKKCFGTSTLYDISFFSDGIVKSVSNLDKLEQDCLKSVLPVKGSNPFHPWVGTELQEYIGSKVSDFGGIRSSVIRDIMSALNSLRNLQEKQAAIQKITSQEVLDEIISVDIEEDIADPTILYLNIVIESLSGKTLEVTQTIKVSSSVII